MKSLIVSVIIVLGFAMGVKSQNYQGTPPQRPIKPTLSIPVFKDSLKLKIDITNLKVLRKIYDALDKKGVGAVYQYSFFISKAGNIILKQKEKRSYLNELNEYIETDFKNYKWEPSHKLNCKRCFVQRLAYFTVIYDTAEKYINCAIEVSGIEGKVFYENINMK